MTPKRAGRPAKAWTDRVADRRGSPEINLRLDGFGFATGRTSDKFRKASRTSDELVFAGRVRLVKDLHDQEFDDVLDALMRGQLTWRVIERAARAGTPGLRALRQTLRHVALETAFEQFRIAYARKNTPKVMKHLEDFAAFLKGALGRAPQVADVTRAQCARYLDQLRIKRPKTRLDGLPVSGATRNRYRASLSLFASWCLERDWLDAHPITAKRVRRAPEHRATMPIMQSAQVRQYLAHVTAHGEPVRSTFLRLLVATGADVNEVRQLRSADIAWGQGDTPTRIIFRRTKTATRERAVPIADLPLLDAVAQQIEAAGDRPDVQPFRAVTDGALWTVHRAARTVASAPTLRLKQLRHVAAQLWRYAGADLETVREWLGHSTLAQTQIYAGFGAVDSVDLPIAQVVARLLGAEESVADITTARLAKRAKGRTGGRTATGA
jgi:site-specific recombinase XerD